MAQTTVTRTRPARERRTYRIERPTSEPLQSTPLVSEPLPSETEKSVQALGAILTAPAIEARHRRLRIFVIAYTVVGLLATLGAGAASLFAFPDNVFASQAVAFGGLLAGVSVLGVMGTVRVLLAIEIEENTRRVNSMAQYTMQTTLDLTAMRDAIEEMTAAMQATSQTTVRQMEQMSRDMRAMSERIESVAEYSRTTAILLHRQSSSEAQRQSGLNYRELGK